MEYIGTKTIVLARKTIYDEINNILLIGEVHLTYRPDMLNNGVLDEEAQEFDFIISEPDHEGRC